MQNKIKEIRKAKKIPAATIAEACNTTTTQLYRLENGDRELSFEWAEKISKALGVPPYELLVDDIWNPYTNEMQMDIYKDGVKSAEIYSLTTDIDAAQYSTIPLYDMPASAGHGMYPTGESPDIIKFLVFEIPYLRKLGNLKHLFGANIRGDSMMPVLPDGSTILVDTSQKDLWQGKKYYIRLGEMRMVKYIEPKPGKILLRSANKAYKDIEINIAVDQPEDFEIIGMVIWHACED